MQLLGRWGSAAPTTMHDTTVKQGFHIVLKFNFRETGSDCEGRKSKIVIPKVKGPDRSSCVFVVHCILVGIGALPANESDCAIRVCARLK